MVSPTLPMDCHYMYVNINKCNPENGFSWGNLIWEIRISGLFYTNYTITHACRIQFSPKQHGISWENKVLGSLQIHFTERVCGVCGAWVNLMAIQLIPSYQVRMVWMEWHCHLCRQIRMYRVWRYGTPFHEMTRFAAGMHIPWDPVLPSCTPECCIMYLQSGWWCAVVEVLDLAGMNSKSERKRRIKPKNIRNGVTNDPELNKVSFNDSRMLSSFFHILTSVRLCKNWHTCGSAHIGIYMQPLNCEVIIDKALHSVVSKLNLCILFLSILHCVL